MPVPPAPLGLVTYADDVSAVSRAVSLADAARPLQHYLVDVSAWVASVGLRFSDGKCTRSLFTSDRRQLRSPPPPLSVCAVERVPCAEPKVLGVTLAPDLSAGVHVHSVAARASARVGLIKDLCCADRGATVEDRTVVYKTFVRPVLDYASAAWSHLARGSHMERLQRVQNSRPEGGPVCACRHARGAPPQRVRGRGYARPR